MKFKVGGLSPEEDAVRLRQACKAAGADFDLIADANQGWTPGEAMRFSRLVEDSTSVVRGAVHLVERSARDARRPPLGVRRGCAGQSESRGRVPRPHGDGSIDFCNFDSSWSGGPTEWRRVAAARGVRRRMAHHEEPHIAAHLLASIPHGTYLESFIPCGTRSGATSLPTDPRRRPVNPAPVRPRPRLGIRSGLHQKYRITFD